MSVVGATPAATQQEHHDVEAALEGGDVGRRPSLPVRLPDVGAGVDEQLDHPHVADQTGVRQEGLPVGVEGVDERLQDGEGRGGEGLQQGVEQRQIALRNRLVEQRVVDSHRRR